VVDNSTLPLIFAKGTLKTTEQFSTLKENFTSLREGLIQYCKPADTSNGDKIITASITDAQNSTQNAVLLNDITMIFIIIVVFITMCIISPLIYLEINKLTGYNIYILYGLRILTCIIFFIGGIISIIAARTPDAPSWLAIMGMIFILSYGLFYIVVFVFQKNTVLTQLTNSMQEEVEPVKSKIQQFIVNQFGMI
jgi:amino acid transporter